MLTRAFRFFVLIIAVKFELGQLCSADECAAQKQTTGTSGNVLIQTRHAIAFEPSENAVEPPKHGVLTEEGITLQTPCQQPCVSSKVTWTKKCTWKKCKGCNACSKSEALALYWPNSTPAASTPTPRNLSAPSPTLERQTPSLNTSAPMRSSPTPKPSAASSTSSPEERTSSFSFSYSFSPRMFTMVIVLVGIIVLLCIGITLVACWVYTRSQKEETLPPNASGLQVVQETVPVVQAKVVAFSTPTSPM